MKIKIIPLNLAERVANFLMVPFMYLLSGTIERPQETHRWNNAVLANEDVAYLKQRGMIRCPPIPSSRRWLGKIPIFHMPIIGGWKKYIVVKKNHYDFDEWYVGWICQDVTGISRIPLRGPVRLLLGPKSVTFFGIRPDGSQVKLEKIGNGSIGDGKKWRKYPLR